MTTWDSTPYTPLNNRRPPAPGAGALAMGRLGGNPYGNTLPGGMSEDPFETARKYSAAWNGMAPHTVSQQTQAGNPPVPNLATPQDPTTTPQTGVATAGPSPQQAGTMNALSPGVFNGNPANGYPSSEAGFGGQPPKPPVPPRMPPTYATQPLQGAPKPLLETPGQPPAPPPPPAPKPLPGPGAPPLPQGRMTTDMGMPGGEGGASIQGGVGHPGDVWNPATARFEPAAQGTAAQGGQAAAQEAIGAPVEPVAPPPEPGLPGQPKSAQQTYQLGQGEGQYTAPKPANWANMSQSQRDAWKQAHAVAAPPAPPASGPAQTGGPAAPGAHQGDASTGQAALDKYADLKGLVLPTQYQGAPVVIGKGTTGNDLINGITDPSLRQIAASALQLWTKLSTPTPQGTPGGSAQEIERLADLQNVLKGYGITFGDTAGGGAGGDGTTDGGTQTPDPDAQIATGGDSFAKWVNYFTGKGWGDKAIAMAEQAVAEQQQNLQRQDRQTGATGFSDAANALKDSGLYKGSQALAQAGLDNPDPVRWDLIRNKTVSDSDKTFQAYQDAVAASQRRRGISADSQAGIVGDLNRERAGDIANRLGDLQIQESQAKRAAERDAISTALATMGATSGQDIGNAATLANLVTGQPANYQNFASGAASAFQNINAAKEAARAAEQSGSFSFSDAAGLLGGIAGTALGGPLGGAIGSALLGTATKAAA